MLSLRTSYAFLLLFCRILEEGSRRDLKTVFKGRARGRGLRSFFKSGGGPRIFPIDEPLSSAFGRLFRAGRHSAFCRPFCHTLLERLPALPHQDILPGCGSRVAGRGSLFSTRSARKGRACLRSWHASSSFTFTESEPRGLPLHHGPSLAQLYSHSVGVAHVTAQTCVVVPCVVVALLAAVATSEGGGGLRCRTQR